MLEKELSIISGVIFKTENTIVKGLPNWTNDDDDVVYL